jgi:hypothetical protein
MKYATEFEFNGSVTAGISGTNNYDPNKIFMGDLFTYASGPSPKDNYITPNKNAYIRIGELCGFAVSNPHMIAWSSRYNWVFLFDATAAAATRRVALVEHDKVRNTLAYKGFITVTHVLAAGNKTIRGGKALYYKHTDGTVAVAAYTVTGTNTQWLLQKIAAGSRIGFGTTDPTQVRQWYTISAVTDATTLVLTSPASIAAGSSYVIESLWLAISNTSSTAGNGGVFLVKGLSYDCFVPGGTAIPEAFWQDDLRGVYWLKDAAVVENQAAGGLGLDAISTDGLTSSGSHFIYVTQLISAASTSCFKYNVRASLSGSPFMVSGSATLAAFTTKTQPYAHALRTLSQFNNGRVFSVNHGPASGATSLFFVGFPSANVNGHIYRAPLTEIASGSTTWVKDFSVVNPLVNSFFSPSGSYRWLPLQADYSSMIDALVVANNSNPDFRTLIVQYDPRLASANIMCFAPDANRLNTTQNSNLNIYPPLPRQYPMSMWTESGYLYTISTTPIGQNSILYILPLGADWHFADYTKQYVITPQMSTSGATHYYSAFIGDANFPNPTVAANKFLSFQTEAYRAYVRTSGIDDNSGAWTILPDSCDMSGITPAGSVQFRFDFKIAGMFCQPGAIFGVGLNYEDNQQDSHYKPSLDKSDSTSKIFAWNQMYPFGDGVPNLRITLTNLDAGVSGTQILTDTVAMWSSGSWQYSRDGGASWLLWNSSYDRPGTYLRYTVSGSLDNASIRAILTQA